MNVFDRIKEQLTNNRVVLFMKGTPDFPQCGFSARAVQILRQCNATFFSINVLEDSDIREGIKQYGNWPTIPQLYVDGELIGGSDIMADLYAQGELQKILSRED